MARTLRYRCAHDWADGGGFDESLYAALRQSPWWMISVAVHVLLFTVAGLLAPDALPAPRATDGVLVVQAPPSEPWDPEEVDPPIPPVTTTPLEVYVPPRAEESEVPEVDLDLPDHGAAGEDGFSPGAFDGPGNNATIGLGPGAGRPFGPRGPGGNRDAGPGGGTRGDQAVEAALRWLAAHQSPDGAWEAAGFDRWCDGKPLSRPGTRRPGQGALRPRGDRPRALRVPRRGLHEPRASTPSREGRRGGSLPAERAGRRGLLRPADQPALHLQPRDRRAGDGRGLRDDPEPGLQGLRPEGAGLHRARPQPLLRLALRGEAGRQRHLGHRLDDDGLEEREAHERGRGEAREGTARSPSTRRRSTGSGPGSTR